MMDANPDVSEMLKRVMSQAPAPVQRSKPQHSIALDINTNPAVEDDQQWWLPGICGQTRVTTNFGHVPAQLLRVGDHVRTRSGRYLAIKQIRETKLDTQFIERRPDARPVLIPQECLDQNLPTKDVFLSPAQRVTVISRLTNPKMVRAKDLSLGSQPIDKTMGMVAYYEILLEAEEDICCEGIWVKSAGVQ